MQFINHVFSSRFSFQTFSSTFPLPRRIPLTYRLYPTYRSLHYTLTAAYRLPRSRVARRCSLTPLPARRRPTLTRLPSWPLYNASLRFHARIPRPQIHARILLATFNAPPGRDPPTVHTINTLSFIPSPNSVFKDGVCEIHALHR